MKNKRCLYSVIFCGIGCLTSLFIPFIGIIFFGLGIYFSYKSETIEMKHSFYTNIVGACCAFLIYVVTIVTTLIG